VTARYVLTPEAVVNLDEIAAFVADDSVDAALQLLERFERAFERLAERPGLGHTREDLTSRPVRFWPVFDYLIVYDPASVPTRIIAVLHGARDLWTLLKNSTESGG
jgi:antitoxin ParD1/3/4/toxin ParE1/3/4